MQDLTEYFMANWGWHIIQLLTFIIVTLVSRSFSTMLGEIRALRSDVKAEHERFKDYVHAEKCEYHRRLINAHIEQTDNALRQMRNACGGCRHKRKTDCPADFGQAGT